MVLALYVPLAVMWKILYVMVSSVLCANGFVATQCSPRNFDHGSIVCVCNATYCDNIPPVGLQKLPRGKFVHYVSSKSGLRMRKVSSYFINQSYLKYISEDTAVFEVDVKTTYQEMLGFGGAVTDSTGINIAQLSRKCRTQLLRSYFGRNGAGFSVLRVPIGSTEFSTHSYSYADVDSDLHLEHFALAKEDFNYKLPVLHGAQFISHSPLLLLASPWSAPDWMKNLTGGPGLSKLRPEHYQLWADYIIKFLDKYGKYGIQFWGLTTQNAPSAGYYVSSSGNVMGWFPEDQQRWLSQHLGPALEANGFEDLQVLILDDYRDRLPFWVSEILENDKAKRYTSGIAVHWYAYDVSSPDLLNQTHQLYPDKFLLYSEASTRHPTGDNNAVKLGMWEPAEWYASNIIEVVNKWVTGWLDGNLALDVRGGPSWSGNNADAPIIVKADSDEFFKQPVFYALAHFSKFIPRGSRRVELPTVDSKGVESAAFLTPESLVAIVLLNRQDKDVWVIISDPELGHMSVVIAAHSIQTLLYHHPAAMNNTDQKLSLYT